MCSDTRFTHTMMLTGRSESWARIKRLNQHILAYQCALSIDALSIDLMYNLSIEKYKKCEAVTLSPLKRSKWIIKSQHYKNVSWLLSKLNGQKYNLVRLNKLDYIRLLYITPVILGKKKTSDINAVKKCGLSGLNMEGRKSIVQKHTENSSMINYETFHKMYTY